MMLDVRSSQDTEHERWRAASPFVAIGAVSIVAGGLVAALTRPLELDAGPWIAAYLVLVNGVAQAGLGAGRTVLARQAPRPRVVVVEVMAWNASTTTIIAGRFLGWPLLTTAGALCLLLAVGCLIRHVPVATAKRRVFAVAHWALGVLVALSAPIGVLLAWARHG
jgi:hypothetical protein